MDRSISYSEIGSIGVEQWMRWNALELRTSLRYLWTMVLRDGGSNVSLLVQVRPPTILPHFLPPAETSSHSHPWLNQSMALLPSSLSLSSDLKISPPLAKWECGGKARALPWQRRLGLVVRRNWRRLLLTSNSSTGRPQSSHVLPPQQVSIHPLPLPYSCHKSTWRRNWHLFVLSPPPIRTNFCPSFFSVPHGWFCFVLPILLARRSGWKDLLVTLEPLSWPKKI